MVIKKFVSKLYSGVFYCISKKNMLTRTLSHLRKLSEEAVMVWREIRILRDTINSSDSTMYFIEESTIQSTLHDMRVEMYRLRQLVRRDEEDLGSIIEKSLREALEAEKRVSLLKSSLASKLFKSPDLEELD